MKKIIGIIAGDPNSINSEIIAKTWKKKSNFRNLDIFIIGSFFLLKKKDFIEKGFFRPYPLLSIAGFKFLF